MTARREFTDAELLEILDMRDRGFKTDLIARKLGVSKGSICGTIHRIRNATEASEHDATMPARWWRDGLARRGDADAA